MAATAKVQKAAVQVAPVAGKRLQILEVASRHFLTYGYEGSSINAMARESGISKESFYRHFRDKEHLFMSVIDEELALYKSKVMHLTLDADATNLRASLIGFAETLLSVLMTDRQQAVRRLVFNEIGRNPEIGRHYFRIGPLLAYENLERFFKSVKARTEFSPRILSRNFTALVLHELMLERVCGVRGNPGAREISTLAAPIVDNFLKAYFRA